MSVNGKTDAVRMIRMMVREQDDWGGLPCIGMTLVERARAILGVKRHRANKDGVFRWEIPSNWPDRVRHAGIDPATLELVDHEAWQRINNAIDQARANNQRKWHQGELHKSIKEAVAKYMPPAPPTPKQIIQNHVMTGRIARELQRGDRE